MCWGEICPVIGCLLPLTLKSWGRSQLRSSESDGGGGELDRSYHPFMWTLHLRDSPPFALTPTQNTSIHFHLLKLTRE